MAIEGLSTWVDNFFAGVSNRKILSNLYQDEG
jgi:hypothetical protein